MPRSMTITDSLDSLMTIVKHQFYLCRTKKGYDM